MLTSRKMVYIIATTEVKVTCKCGSGLDSGCALCSDSKFENNVTIAILSVQYLTSYLLHNRGVAPK